MKHQPRILMIEDMVKYHQMFAIEIEDALNLKVEFCTNGEDGLKTLREAVPAFDLLILDLSLPGISGEEVLHAIREEPALDNLVVMIMTGQSSAETEGRLLRAGANEFIEKGCAPNLFIARLAAQLRTKAALDRLTQLSVDREIFAAGVLHDLRNIEANLLATCDLIAMALKSDPVKNLPQTLEDVENLRAQVLRMDEYAGGIINQIRDTYTDVKLNLVSIKSVTEWVEQFLKGGQQKKSLRVNIQTPLAPVLADENLLRLVLMNLLQNALKYCADERSPEVNIYQRPSKTPGWVVTCIEDNGLGVAEADLRKIFQPFFRSEKNKKSHGGFGLGLSVVSKAITNLGGKIWAERPTNQSFGTNFCFELKIVQ